MKRSLLLPSLLFPLLLSAQTYFYVNAISIAPAMPDDTDQVTISLEGDLSSTGAYIVSASASAIGNTVEIDIMAADPGGLAVLVPHSEPVTVGPLVAGSYTVVINGTFVADLAPAGQHQFTVTGSGAGTACDSLAILSLNYAPFDANSIELVVQNSSSNLFDYPSFILFDQNNDTLAKESVFYFGIGSSPQSHRLTVHPAANLPTGPFTGTLELWTGFTTNLACSYVINEDLCPPDSCSWVHPYIANTGGALVTASFQWSIADTLANILASGVLELDAQQQEDSASVCLPPGNYVLEMSTPQITGGQLSYGVWHEGTFDSTGETYQQGLVNTLDFSLFGACINPGLGITVPVITEGPLVRVQDDRLLVTNMQGGPIGVFQVLDLQGRLQQAGSSNASTLGMPLHDLARGIYLFRTSTGVTRFLRP